MEKDLKSLMKHFPHAGAVKWIGIRPEKRGEVHTPSAVTVDKKKGLEGDHYSGRSRKRQVTLIQAEHLDAVARFLHKESVDPKLTRRNLVVSGLNLNALKDHNIQIGEEVRLEITGPCHPCSRMEENLGPGGYNAMRGHGGLTAKVEQGGTIKIGDEVKVLEK